MKKVSFLTLLCALFFSAQATITPVALTGYNADIISNGTTSPLSSISSFMTSGFDSAGYALVSEDYNYAGYTPSYSLPTGGLVTSALIGGLTFQLASYSSNNALRFHNSGDNGTLAFVVPQNAGALYVCGLSGSGISGFDIVVNFSDATTQTFSSLSFPDWYAGGGSVVGIGRVSTSDDHTEGDGTAPSLFQIALNIDPSNYSKTITGITVTKTSSTGFLGIVAVSAVDICSGAPTAGAVSASALTSCSEFTSNLSLPGSTASAGITYQWQSSTDGAVWTDVSGATDASYAADVTDTIYYRAYITCTISGLSDTSTSIELLTTTPSAVAATLPFNESFESWIGACYTYDRPSVNWLNDPTSGNNSWRRDDQGTDASWTSPTGGAYSPVSTVGSHSARFHSYYSGVGTVGNLDLHLDLSTPGSKQIAFDYMNSTSDAFGSDELFIQISDDGGATFTTLGTYDQVDAWTHETLTTTSTAANAIVRFSAVSDYGYSDIGIDNVSAVLLLTCTGTPTAGTISASVVSGCSPYNSTLNVDVPVVALGIAYQWQTSTDGTTWTDISGETNTSYSATGISVSTYFRAYVTCSFSGGSDTTAPLELLYVVPSATYASLPFFEGFENWIGTCFAADRPGLNWLTNPSSGNDSWRRDDQASDAAWSGPAGGTYSPTSTEASHSARFHSYLASSGSTGSMDLYVDLSLPGTKQIVFDYHNSGGPDNLQVQLSEDGGSTFTTILTVGAPGDFWAPQMVTTTSTSATAILRFLGTSDDGSSDIGVDSLSIVVLPHCSGTPVAGTLSATILTGCSPYTSTVSFSTPTVADGISYQWQSSTDGVTYTNIPGETNLTYTASVSASTYYRAYVNCSFSSSTDTSSPLELFYVVPTATYATIPFFESFESWIGSCFTADRPGAHWLTNPSSGNDAWRRDDQAADASWTGPAGGAYSPVSTDASHSARFHSYLASSGSTGTMDLYIDLSPVGTKLVSFDYHNSAGPDNLQVQLSEDGGSTFTTLHTVGAPGAFWAPQSFTTTSVAANAIIRFLATSDDGGSDIGVDSLSISLLPACTGTPVAGTISATDTFGCSSYPTTISVVTPVVATGISYQWQSSPDGIAWTDISGETGITYTTTVTAITFVRAYVVCSFTGGSDTTNAQELSYVPPVATYATVPFFESFESWIGSCYSYDRPGVNWLTDPATGNNSWRRYDEGSDASWTSIGNGTYSPSFTDGAYSARFHSYYAGSGTVGNMDLYIDLSAAGTKQIAFDYHNADGSDVLNVELSEDGGVTFPITLGTLGAPGGSWVTEHINTTSTATNAVIRFSATSDYGNTDIGIDSLYISVLPLCTGTPVAGTASASVTTGCAPYSTTLSVTTPLTATGISYQWQSSADGVTWTNISGETNTTYSTTVSANIYFRFYVVCSFSSSADTSASVALTYVPPVATYATVPFFESFESWIGSCYSFDRPGTNWLTSPATGNNSWRRDDQGSDASWGSTGSGGYTPVFTTGAHSARFHSYLAPDGSVGTMDLYINLSAAGTKEIRFDYHNTNGSDGLDVQLSEDGGTTFTSLTSLSAPGNFWVPELITTTSTAANAIIRFSATSDYGSTDIGIDSLSIAVPPPPCPAPTGLAVTAITTTGATASWTGAAGGTGYEYVVDGSASDPSGAGTATTSTSVAVGSLTSGTIYYVHVRTDCGAGSESVWVTTSFTTLSPCLAPTGLTISGITTTSATATWDAVTGSAGYQYVINGAATDPTAPGTATTATTAAFSSLTSGTTYYVHVRTECTDGDSSVWVTTSFTTLSPCLAPTGLAISGITATGATATWDAVAGSAGYQYVIDGSAVDPSAPGTATTATNATFSSLTPATAYFVHVRTECTDGDSSVWVTTSFTTLPLGCSAPAGLSITSITTTGATASWGAVPGAAGYQYVVDGTAADPATAGTPTGLTTVTLSSLASGTVYFFHVRTECTTGDSSTWSTIAFTTLPVIVPCDAPTGLVVTGITTSGATASWDVVFGAAGYQYVVDNTPTDPLVAGIPTTSPSAPLSGLSAGTLYYVHVRTECTTGDSSVWVTDTFTTLPAVVPCTAASGLAATSVTDSSAVLSWNVTIGVTGYEYVINTTSSAPTGGGTFTTGTSYTDTSLACNTTYYLHVRTDCSADSAAWVTISFTTDTCYINGVPVVNKSSYDIQAFPNPATERVNVVVTGIMTADAAIQLTDVSGRVIDVYHFNGNKAEINVTNVASGVYFLNYIDGVNRKTLKMNKQ